MTNFRLKAALNISRDILISVGIFLFTAIKLINFRSVEFSLDIEDKIY